MHSPTPYVHHQPAHEAPAVVRTVSRGDVVWNRPIFKAPPLTVPPRSESHYYPTAVVPAIVSTSHAKLALA